MSKKLSDWLADNGMSIAAFCREKLDGRISANAMGRYMAGTRRITAQDAFHVWEATGREVDLDAWADKENAGDASSI